MLLGLLLQRETLKKVSYATCPSCLKKSEVDLWDKQTRAFLGDDIPSIKNAKKTKIPYQCPECYSGHLSKSIKIT
jgi:ssDNA-binding Zn-finger/Zn-ribbon topoisomerase 1